MGSVNVEIKKMKKGIDYVTDGVKITLGPNGCNVCLDRHSSTPLITSEGKNIFKEMVLKNPYENIGAQLVRELALKVDDEIGDGSTTAIILMQAIISEGLKRIEAGANPVTLNRGIDLALYRILKEMKTYVHSIETNMIIHQMIDSRVNEIELGEIVYRAVTKVNHPAGITIERSRSNKNSLEEFSGFVLEQNVLTEDIEKQYNFGKSVYENVDVLIINNNFQTKEEILPILEFAIERKRSLLMIVDGIKNEALGIVNANNQHGICSIIAIQAPAHGENRINELLDIEALVGATAILDNTLEIDKNILLEIVGHVEKVIVEKNKMIIVGGKANDDKVLFRKKELQDAQHNAESEFASEVYQLRLRRLERKHIIIKIYSDTEIDYIEKKWNVNNAIRAVFDAKEYGYVLGGEVFFLKMSDVLEKAIVEINGDEKLGVSCVSHSLKKPFYQLLSNAGYNAEGVSGQIINEVEFGMGFNVLSGCIEDLYSLGIVEPAKHIEIILRNAVGMAKMILTTNAIVNK